MLKGMSQRKKAEVKDAERVPSEGEQMMQGGRKKNQRQSRVLLLIISWLLLETSALGYTQTMSHNCLQPPWKEVVFWQIYFQMFQDKVQYMMQHRIAQCKPEMQFRDTAVQGRMYNVLFPFSLAGISLPCPLCNSAVASLSNTSTLLLKRNTFEFKCRDTSLVGVAYIDCFFGHQCMCK